MTKKKTHKTNAMRMLEAKGIPYVAHYYSPHVHSAQGVDVRLGLPIGQVFKTLVVVTDKASAKAMALLAIVPGHREWDLKKLARAAREKRLRMATQRQAESLTGLLVGGISPLALVDEGLGVFLDASAEEYAEILISAGRRGINLQLAVADLVKVTGARLHPISRPRDAFQR